MKEGVRQHAWGNEMSATVLSAFYDMDLLYKQDKSMNMNALHINSMLDKKAVGAPVTSPGSGSFSPGFFRRNSTSNLEALNNGNKYSMGSYGSLKENTPSGGGGSSSSAATALHEQGEQVPRPRVQRQRDRGVLAAEARLSDHSTPLQDRA
uniref:Tis11B-like protein N-terminal domain-containing protein n=1 Tax=Gasterosteus aculeatus TaxID=69293 RepID=G3NDT2_GASAC